MVRIFIMLFAFMLASCNNHENPASESGEVASGKSPIALVIHGGAGTITRASMTPEKEMLYRQKLAEALDSGYSVLAKGGKSMDAVVAVITLLEDSPLFNAGRGSVFTNAGKNEMDASVMEGKTLMAGAVAGVTRIKNPIKAAVQVMNRSGHVLLAGEGAELYAKNEGLEIVDPTYFFDSARYQQWQRIMHEDKTVLSEDKKYGTVGCVALDSEGNIAAGTSTGGMTNKKFGRIGDSPIIGAGTYANNKTCGISSTGHGEYFIRLAVAYDISALMEYKGLSLENAASDVINTKLASLGGTGGVIGLNTKGDIMMVFNTEGMYRGYRKEGEQARTFIYKDE